ncbi:MAG TPA: hydrogenase nickel incorporation protein HypB [Blastocatellia bacterium]|nr:hydrogenase nickel incorporation protein HypB [Blastocatellia bacterium]
MPIITIERKILEKNDEIARQNRARLAEHGILALNMVSSPGSGKTSLIERTLEHFDGKLRIAVIEGDVQTNLDAQRIARYGVPVIQIVTQGGCHLEAQLVREAMAKLDLAGVDLLIIENVGNLVCPANYDLGEAMKVVIISTTEGDDKPLKYPAMFRQAAVLVINKTDLLPYLNCRLDVLRHNALQINPALKVFETSCVTGTGISEWCAWLEALTRQKPPAAEIQRHEREDPFLRV